MGKSFAEKRKSTEYEHHAECLQKFASNLELSMLESLEYFELVKAKARHEGLEKGTVKRDHSFSLIYSKKYVNELESKVSITNKMRS